MTIATETTPPRPNRPIDEKRLAAARQFAIEAGNLLANTRCENVVVLDMQGLSPITDFLVIGTGTSPRQMRSVCDELEEIAEPKGHYKLSRSGDESGQWIVIDFVDVVAHVFSPEARSFYDLDNLWGDAKPIDWKQSEGAAKK